MLLSLAEILVYHVILSPLIEEVFFRGVIQTLLSPLVSIKFEYRQFSVSLPLLITSVLFALIHFQYSFTAIVFIFSLGVFCGHLRAKYQSIVPGIFAHFVFNLLAVFIPKIILVIDQALSVG
jgi:membrane protease YdiL (CAAX protease family)